MIDRIRSASFLKIRVGQVALLIVATIGIGSLAGWSVYSSTPHQVEKLSILAESNDAASLAYSQRESFNLALIIEDWVRGEVVIRDVEISRALLGQRLQVKLVNGNPTYDAMTNSYKAKLEEIDKFIIANSTTPLSGRTSAFNKLRPNYDLFLTETRRMSKAIQEESLKQVNKVVQNRTRSEFYQSGILLITILAGLILLVWLVRDLAIAFRKAKFILQEEQLKLNSATQMLEISRAMDRFQSWITEMHLTALTSSDFANLFEKRLQKELSLAALRVSASGDSYKIEFPVDAGLEEIASKLVRARFADAIKQHQSRLRLFVEAEYRASHDFLTGFLNERGLSIALSNQAGTSEKMLAALFIDVDRFHRINDSMGFEFGDSVMTEIASRMNALSTSEDLVARLNSDEFVFISPVANEAQARAKALALQSDMQFTTHHSDIELNLTFTIGLVVYAPAEFNPSELIHHGAIALNIANRQIRAGFAIYSEVQGQEYVESLAEEFAIRQALKLNEFELYFQPVIELSTNQVMGGEALIRWNRPGYGVLLPNEFLSKVSDHDLEIELGDWIIESALRFRANARLFQEELSLDSFRVGINVEASQIRRSDFADKLMESVQKLNVDATDVSIEITEHSLTDGDIALQQLRKLKASNFVIAIDDFGTGYSNLSQVNSLPISVLKIDRSFLIPGAGTSMDRQLILDIKQLADNLKLRVVAEGVESVEVEKFLVDSGITRVQGFLYSPPLPEVNFWGWVRDFKNSQSLQA